MLLENLFMLTCSSNDFFCDILKAYLQSCCYSRPIRVEQTVWLLLLGTRNSGRGCWSLRKPHFSNYLAVSTWILNGSSIECLEKKYQPFSLAGVWFGSVVNQISGLKSAWGRSGLCLTLLLCNCFYKVNSKNDKLNVWRTRKKSEPQMGFEPTTLLDLVGCSNHWATGDSMVSKGQFMGLDWNHITRLHSQVMTDTHELTDLWGTDMRDTDKLRYFVI